jgi:hypothetical protein
VELLDHRQLLRRYGLVGMARQPLERGVLGLRCRHHGLRHVWIAAAMTDKYCKDCAHKCVGDNCLAPQIFECVPKFDLVHGPRETVERRELSPSCYVLRGEKGECGPDGKWFEPKVPPEIKRPKPWWRAWG